jgi:hypothetical protein
MSLVQFKYRNFQPTEELGFEASDVLAHVQDHAPMGATMIAMMEKKENTYICTLEIYSRRGPTYASSSDENPIEALKKLERNALEKISKIKETRFFSKLAC